MAAMTLGDFFKAAPYARPVCPRPITFTADSSGEILPGGERNPHGTTVSAQVTAAMVFLGSSAVEDAWVDAAEYLRRRYGEKLPLHEMDARMLELERRVQILWRTLRIWDPEAKRSGERIFEEADGLRCALQPTEVARLMEAYNTYVDDEHPEAVDQKTFRGAQGAGEAVVKAAPR